MGFSWNSMSIFHLLSYPFKSLNLVTSFKYWIESFSSLKDGVGGATVAAVNFDDIKGGIFWQIMFYFF